VHFVNSLKNTFIEMNASQNFSVRPVAVMLSMIQNIPQFQDVRTQQDAEECLSGFYNIFLDTQLKEGVRSLFEFELGVQVTPLEDLDGGISETLQERQFEFKC